MACDQKVYNVYELANIWPNRARAARFKMELWKLLVQTPRSRLSTPSVRLLGERYRVESLLGQGGMGAVYLARDTSVKDVPVALKMMHLQLTDPERRTQAVEQFQQEARLLATLQHPGLTKVTDYFVEGDRYVDLVMTYLAGKSWPTP